MLAFYVDSSHLGTGSRKMKWQTNPLNCGENVIQSSFLMFLSNSVILESALIASSLVLKDGSFDSFRNVPKYPGVVACNQKYSGF